MTIRREEDEREIRLSVQELGSQLFAGHPRKAQVENHEVKLESELGKQCQRLRSVRRHHDVVAGADERARQQTSQGSYGIYSQNERSSEQEIGSGPLRVISDAVALTRRGARRFPGQHPPTHVTV